MTANALRLTASPVLPLDLEIALAEIGARLACGDLIVDELDRALDLMAGLPAAQVAQADLAIADAARLHLWRLLPSRVALAIPIRTSKSHTEQLLRTPKLENLFIFHRDGRLREAALLKLSGELSTAFLFAAVAWRLNDWAPQVRAAAVRCARRCFPATAAEVIVSAAAALLVRQSSWARWAEERVVLDEAFNRADVAERLSDLLVREPTGPMSTMLRYALRTSAIDVHLERIARDAVQPSVRAAALNTLINGKAEWPRGYDWQWVDKSMGLRRRMTVFGHRELSVVLSRRALIALGIYDRSAAVRRVALDGVMRHLLPMQEGQEYAALLVADRSPSVRERAEFILRPR